MELKDVREWAKGKPEELGFVGACLAIMPEIMRRGFGEVYSGSHHHPEWRVPDTEQWAQLYHDPKRVLKGCWEYVGLGSPEDFEYKEVLTSFLNAVNAFIVSNDKSLAMELGEPDVPPNEFKASLFRYLFSLLETYGFRGPVEAGSEYMEESLALPIECLFLLRVWVACWIIHKEPFFPLFRRARHGDIDALEKLVLVDRGVLTERRISKLWTRISEDNTSEDFERIHRALANRPALVGYEPQDAKIAAAGLIAKMSEAKNHPLSASQIGEVFDALARDLAPEGQVVHKDPDVDRKSSQWRKAVARQKDKWSESPFFSSSH